MAAVRPFPSKQSAAGWIIPALLALAAPAAGAQPGPSDTWRCWHNAPEHVTCLWPRGPQPFLHIPLYNVPLDMEGPRELARAIVCGARQGCNVHFTADAPGADELDAAFDALTNAGD